MPHVVCIAVIGTIMLLAEGANAQDEPRRPRSLAEVYVASVGLQLVDTTITLEVLHGGSAVERNPAMKAVVKHPPAFIALKAGVTASSILVAEKLWKSDRRRMAVALMVVTNCLMVSVAAHNVAAIR